MDFERIEEIVRRIMEADGFSRYTIVSTAEAVGSNVCVVVVETEPNAEGKQLKDTLYINNESEEIMHRSQHWAANVTVSDTVGNISDEVTTLVGMSFTLTEPVYCSQTWNDQAKIQWVYEDNEPKLIGFKINCKNETEMIDALRMASRVISYITLETGRFVYYTIHREVIGGHVQPAQAAHDKIILDTPLDPTNSSFNDLISKDSKENQKIFHFASGIKAFEAYSYAQAIRDFFLIIEYSGLSEEGKYKSLRNAVSHNKLNSPVDICNLEDHFGITMKDGEYLDVTNPNIQTILKNAAEQMRQLAQTHISDLLHDDTS